MAFIRIEDDLKVRLEKLKKGISHNQFLERVIDYFESTGITPEERNISPSESIKKSTSRIIEVVRGIEKKQIAYFDKILSRLEKANNPNLEDFVEVGEVEQLLNKYEVLEKENTELQNEVKKLLTRELPITTQDALGGKGALVEKIIDDLRTKFLEDKFDREYIRIDKSLLDKAFSRLKDVCKGSSC